MATKHSQLLELLQKAREAEKACMNSLSTSERQQEGQADHWSARDILAHIAEWKMTVVIRLKAYLHDQDGPNYPDVDARNAEHFANNRTRPWEEVGAMLEYAYTSLLAQVRSLSEGQLLAPPRYAWQHDDTLLVRIPFVTCFHSIIHLADIYTARGNRVAADGLWDDAVRCMFILDEDPAWRARWIYEQAGYYASVQDKAKALAGLRKACADNPDFIGKAQKDRKFQLLWEDAEFRSLPGK